MSSEPSERTTPRRRKRPSKAAPIAIAVAMFVGTVGISILAYKVISGDRLVIDATPEDQKRPQTTPEQRGRAVASNDQAATESPSPVDDAPRGGSPSADVDAGTGDSADVEGSASAAEVDTAPWRDEPVELHTVAAGRSAVPMPGETIDRPIRPTRLADIRPAPNADAATMVNAGADTVEWHRAHEFIGKQITVEAEIRHTHNTGSVCYLNFTEDWRDSFYAIIFSDLLKAWPEPPEKYFLNKKVRITGEVQTYRGRPQIRIEQKAQIEIVQ